MKESFLCFLSCLPALSEVLHLSDAKIPLFYLISFGFVLGTLLLWQIFVIYTNEAERDARENGNEGQSCMERVIVASFSKRD